MLRVQPKNTTSNMGATKIDLYCHDCGLVVKALLRSDTINVMCPSCFKFNVFSYPNKEHNNQAVHYKRLMFKIRKNITGGYREAVRNKYTPKEDWLRELY